MHSNSSTSAVSSKQVVSPEKNVSTISTTKSESVSSKTGLELFNPSATFSVSSSAVAHCDYYNQKNIPFLSSTPINRGFDILNSNLNSYFPKTSQFNKADSINSECCSKQFKNKVKKAVCCFLGVVSTVSAVLSVLSIGLVSATGIGSVVVASLCFGYLSYKYYQGRMVQADNGKKFVISSLGGAGSSVLGCFIISSGSLSAMAAVATGVGALVIGIILITYVLQKWYECGTNSKVVIGATALMTGCTIVWVLALGSVGVLAGTSVAATGIGAIAIGVALFAIALYQLAQYIQRKKERSWKSLENDWMSIKKIQEKLFASKDWLPDDEALRIENRGYEFLDLEETNFKLQISASNVVPYQIKIKKKVQRVIQEKINKGILLSEKELVFLGGGEDVSIFSAGELFNLTGMYINPNEIICVKAFGAGLKKLRLLEKQLESYIDCLHSRWYRIIHGESAALSVPLFQDGAYVGNGSVVLNKFQPFTDVYNRTVHHGTLPRLEGLEAHELVKFVGEEHDAHTNNWGLMELPNGAEVVGSIDRDYIAKYFLQPDKNEEWFNNSFSLEMLKNNNPLDRHFIDDITSRMRFSSSQSNGLLLSILHKIRELFTGRTATVTTPQMAHLMSKRRDKYMREIRLEKIATLHRLAHYDINKMESILNSFKTEFLSRCPDQGKVFIDSIDEKHEEYLKHFKNSIDKKHEEYLKHFRDRMTKMKDILTDPNSIHFKALIPSAPEADLS